MSQIVATSCGKCFHSRENHLSGGVCSGSIECFCEKFMEPELFYFAQEVEKEKSIRKHVGKRVQYILERIPQTRNAGEKTFYKIYIEIWHGFKIRKNNPSIMDTDTWNRLPNQDLVNREKRRVKQHNEELRTYNPKVIENQNIIFQALLEMGVED